MTPEDTVYCLGDFSMAKRPVKFFGRKLHGEKHLIAENHDRCHPQKQNYEAIQAIYRSPRIQDLQCGADDADRGYVIKHQELRPKDQGLWLLHGHVHEKWKVKNRMINVGVDAWDFYPVPITTIANLIQQGATP